MELFTLALGPYNGLNPRQFNRQDTIDDFESLIWTERYYGDGDVEVVLPLTMDLINKVYEGVFLGINESNEIMIVETVTIEDFRLKVQGISILPWLNNRFVRTSKLHKITTMEISGIQPGEILWQMIYNAISPDVLLPENTDIYPDFLAKLIIPEIGIHDLDVTGSNVTVKVSFGPLYDELRKIAETYKVGMQMVLETNYNPLAEQPLGFRSYRGLNKTYTQDPAVSQNPTVRFSPYLESLDNVTELHSQADYKTLALAFAPNLDSDIGDPDHGLYNSGVAYPTGLDETDGRFGLDCRAVQVLSDITGYPEPLSNVQIRKIMALLDHAAREALADASKDNAVDGEVVSTSMFEYGRDYGLGDLVEVEGTTGAISISRVTEYIRSQDTNGEKAYPTLEIVEDVNKVLSPSIDLRAPLPIDANDDLGDAIELVGDFGVLSSTNIDCHTDGMTDDGNTDWLVHEFGESTGDRNWHTMWYKWAVPTDRWVEGHSVFSAFLTNYDAHMVMLLLTPFTGTIPGPGDPPATPDTYTSLGGDSTDINKKVPYGMLGRAVFDNVWTADLYEPWIYIGIATPPAGKLNNAQNDRGGRFTLKWYFTP